MGLEVLVSAVNADPRELAKKMNLRTDAVIVDQCDREGAETFEHNGKTIRCLYMKSRGVGLSRNAAFDNATADICLFGDEDIVYESDYEEKILNAFKNHPEADILLFNVKVCDERRTYWNDSYGRVQGFASGRYPAYSIAARRAVLLHKALRFSVYFGGGAKYSNGEDSLFLRDASKAGLRMYKTPEVIGEEIPRPSTWFHGYNDKFFYDRGVLYKELYGPAMAPVRALRWLTKNRKEMCKDYPYGRAMAQMRKGWRDGVKA